MGGEERCSPPAKALRRKDRPQDLGRASGSMNV